MTDPHNPSLLLMTWQMDTIKVREKDNFSCQTILLSFNCSEGCLTVLDPKGIDMSMKQLSEYRTPIFFIALMLSLNSHMANAEEMKFLSSGT